MARGILKTASEIERGDILVVDDKEHVIVTVWKHVEVKRVQLELRNEEDPFALFHKYFEMEDLFIIRGKVA
jgi:hypothetical protein